MGAGRSRPRRPGESGEPVGARRDAGPGLGAGRQGGSRILGRRGDTGHTVLALWPLGPPMATGPERVLLASDDVNFWQARYSPDHRWVSFVAQRMRNPGTVEIGVVGENSNHAKTWTRILEDHVWPDKPRWSPDGRTLYFLSQGRDGYFDLWGVPIDPARGTQSGSRFKSPISARHAGISIPICSVPSSASPRAGWCCRCRASRGASGSCRV